MEPKLYVDEVCSSDGSGWVESNLYVEEVCPSGGRGWDNVGRMTMDTTWQEVGVAKTCDQMA